MLKPNSIQSMNSSAEETGNERIKLQEIPHLFHWKGEFDEIRSACRDSKTPKERTSLLLDGLLQSPSIKNMYMVFEAFEEMYVFLTLKFDEDHVAKLIEFKNKNGFGHVHPFFLCDLRFLRYRHRNFLDLLLRCEDLVSCVKSEITESDDCVSATKFLNQDSIYSFHVIPDALRESGNRPVIKVHVKGYLGNAFNMQLESDTLDAKNIHIIFRVMAIYNEKRTISEYMHFQSWFSKPSFSMDYGCTNMWGDICLSRRACGNDCEDVVIKLIAFVDVTKHAEDRLQSLIQRNNN